MAMSNTPGKDDFGTLVKTPGVAVAAPDAPLKAMSLLGRWVRVSQAHVAFGGGCSCGDDSAPLHVNEMAMRVMDTLAAKHSDNAAIQTLLAERAGYKRNETGSIGGLLKAIGMRSAKGVNDEDQILMLAELERSIESLDEVLRGR